MFPSHRPQAVDLLANQLTGFYMMGTLVVKRLKNNNFFLKRLQNVLYLLDKFLKVKVHKMLRCQTNVYVPTFMYILLFQAYCKHNIRLKLEKL